MKKLTALFLILVMLLPLAACGEKTAAPADHAVTPAEPDPAVTPAEPDPALPEPDPAEPKLYTREEIQQAACQTALAYYYHNPYVQYEGGALVSGMGGTRALDSFCTPESVSPDEYLYTFCSDFGYRVYREATGWTYSRSSTNFLTSVVVKIPDDDPLTVFRYDSTVDPRTRDDAVAECHSLIQPGDLITYSVKSGEGHLLVYVGDLFGDGKEYILHSTSTGGGTLKWDGDKAGINPIEPNGSILCNTTEEILFAKGKSRYLGNAVVFNVIRPANILLDESGMGTLTPSAESRLRYPMLECWKECEETQYNDAAIGADYTLRLRITNHSTQDYTGLNVTEPLPEGQTFVSAAEGGVLKDGNVCWTLNVPAGKTVEFGYTIRTAGAPGDTIRFAPGTVDAIPTRDVSVKLGAAHLSDAQVAALRTFAESPLPAWLTGESYQLSADLVNRFYREVLGVDPKLPTDFSAVISGISSRKTALGTTDKFVTLKEADKIDAAYTDFLKMTLNKHFFGRYANTGIEEMHTRNIEFVDDGRYQPGDVFIGSCGAMASTFLANKLTIQIYLGDGKVLQMNTSGASVDTFENTTLRNLGWDFGFCIRPVMLDASLSK